ncbi:type II toxin-antitoxin system RelE family toxin [Mucilaginibacter arboris]|uniref:Type II toxin-antitoxin system RelE/ParE family toxin n=1 Tax=Mucilaginibacter arboris TaxID=2682090 RepID=A0A7K1SXR1_9SPHI|nr:type II toxin-antitoxin system RelE/ParE family toxin [Mucilaginibacter arboris]MVN22121.1 type II toxin-antitoxin system RelE/ParE family toxin [Mucilaginibacter arboris]
MPVNVIYNKKFLKDLALLPSKQRIKVEKLVFQEIPAYEHLSEIKNLKKLQGYELYFRIRVGDYRIGLKIENQNLVFERILHRKDIYNLFP